MRRGAKRTKPRGEAEPPIARKSLESEGSRVRGLEKRLAAALKREAEALAQQTATVEILRVISSSPTDVQPVFDTIVRNAVGLCGAIYGTVSRTEGDLIYLAAYYNFTSEQANFLRQAYPIPLSSQAPVPRSMRAGAVYRAADVEAEPEWQARSEEMRAGLRSRGVRSFLAVPMLRRGEAIGAIILTHREVGAFSDAHVDLIKTFADQAVIAIENVRLFNENYREFEDWWPQRDSNLTVLTSTSRTKSTLLHDDSFPLVFPAKTGSVDDPRAYPIYQGDRRLCLR